MAEHAPATAQAAPDEERERTVEDIPLALRISDRLRKFVDFVGRWGSWFALPMILFTVLRITSYNVCYTKLLRVRVVDVAVAEHQGEKRGMKVPFELLQHRRLEHAPEILYQKHLQPVQFAVVVKPGDLARDDVEHREQDHRQREPGTPAP